MPLTKPQRILIESIKTLWTEAIYGKIITIDDDSIKSLCSIFFESLPIVSKPNNYVCNVLRRLCNKKIINLELSVCRRYWLLSFTKSELKAIAKKRNRNKSKRSKRSKRKVRSKQSKLSKPSTQDESNSIIKDYPKLQPENRGYTLLQKLGWIEGGVLGANLDCNSTALREPLQASRWKKRIGIGSNTTYL